MENFFKINVIKIYKAIIVLLISLLVFFLTSCEKKVIIVTQEIDIENIEAIDIKSFGEFNVEYSEESKLIFKGDKALFDVLNIKVINGVLIVDINEINEKKYDRAEFFISMPKIKRVNVEGTAIVILNDFSLQKDDLNIEILGQADVKINNFEKVKNLEINISGTATIDALSNFRNLNELNINIIGSGTYNGYLLEANTCNIRFSKSGTGSCKVSVKENLNINIEGNGEVFFKGSPEVNSVMEGSGFVLNQNS